MKWNSILLLLSLFISFGSCGVKKQKIQEAKEKAIKDSIENVRIIEERREKEIKDSIARIEQEKVIGDIVFGINEKEASKKISAFIKNSSRTKYSDSDLTYPFIGNYEFSPYGSRGYYYDDKLYMLVIQGQVISWDDYENEVPREVRYITDVIKLKYGEPSTRNSIPERYNLEKGDKFLLNSWTVGTKQIDVRLSDSETYYSVDLYIYQPKIVEKRNQENRNAEKATTEKDKNIF